MLGQANLEIRDPSFSRCPSSLEILVPEFYSWELGGSREAGRYCDVRTREKEKGCVIL